MLAPSLDQRSAMHRRSCVRLDVAARWLLLASVFGCSRAARTAPATPATSAADVAMSPMQDVVDEGRKIFHGQGLCFACHGGRLQGGPVAPALAGPRWDREDTSFVFILHTVRAGSPHTPMVAAQGGIDAAQELQVANYVYAVSHGKAQP